MQKKVLVSVTTFYSDWQQQIEDIRANNISEFAIFLTGLKRDQRPAIYKKLETLSKVNIPFVHAHSDTTKEEIDYLIDRFGTKYLNIHTEQQFPLINDLSSHFDKILIENSGPFVIEPVEAARFAGFCLDVSHLENDRLHGDENYEHILSLIEKFPVKANHISGIAKTPRSVPGNDSTYDRHALESLDQLQYVKRYLDDKFLGEYLALELVNDIKAQLQAKERVESILNP